MSNEEDFINKGTSEDESKIPDLLRRGLSLVEAIQHNRLESEYAGLIEGSGNISTSNRGFGQSLMRSIIGGAASTATFRQINEDLISISQSVGTPGSKSIRDNISNILTAIKDGEFVNRDVLDEILEFASSTTSSADVSEVGSLFGDADLNNDGRIDPLELASSLAGRWEHEFRSPTLLNSTKNPLYAFGQRHQNFIRDASAFDENQKRTIPERKIALPTTKKRSDQTNLVKQGYARYDTDINDFNVAY